MIKKPDIVSLKWVLGLMYTQTENAEAGLVEFGHHPQQKQALLRCMWAVHQITSTLRTLGMSKAEILTMEMERSLNYLYKDKVAAGRSNLVMGGLMQALKVIPAYLEHTEAVRLDTGRGLEQYVNDLRRYVGERPRPRALFFYMNIPEGAGITTDATPVSDEEIRSRANVMLALYLEMAKQALKGRDVGESMKNVARIARKMQILFAGTVAERFWFTMIGLCEGIAGKLIAADDCVAQIFKAGAFSIKYARENGGSLDDSIDYDAYTQQMLYYITTCKSRPVHISSIRSAFKIDESTLEEATRPLVHTDALVIAITGALDHLNRVVEFVETNDLAAIIAQAPEDRDSAATESIEAAECRLVAAGQLEHADSLQNVQRQFKQLFAAGEPPTEARLADAVRNISNRLINVKLDIEHKLQHGLHSSYEGKDFELRDTVANATFRQMSLVENCLHQILRRKALKSALDKKPEDGIGVLRLTTALQRHLNKTEEGHDELRQAIRDADNGEADIDLLYGLACEYQDQLKGMSDREALDKSLQTLQDIADALIFSNMEREGRVMEQCHRWLAAASDAGSVHEDEPFRCFADAFAQVEMHLQRSLIDPMDDTSQMLAFAEQRAGELDKWIKSLPPGRAAAVDAGDNAAAPESARPLVEDAEMPPQFRAVFIEESEEIVAELAELTSAWLREPEGTVVLRDIRRHFHTFKGNGRAVGANILGELGWAVQDMLDRSLDGDLFPGEHVQNLMRDVVDALPALVQSYSNSEGPDVERIRALTDACFEMASKGCIDAPDAAPATSEPAAATRQEVSETIDVTGGLAAVPAARKILTH